MNWFDKLWNSKYNPFGNADNPVSITSKKWFYWYFIRNPLHNFMTYWIGFKDKNLDYTQIWNTNQRWNLVLPFFSYRGKKWEFYVGWRPPNKAFGIALRRVKNV